jgi:hypothetical protein
MKIEEEFSSICISSVRVDFRKDIIGRVSGEEFSVVRFFFRKEKKNKCIVQRFKKKSPEKKKKKERNSI